MCFISLQYFLEFHPHLVKVVKVDVARVAVSQKYFLLRTALLRVISFTKSLYVTQAEAKAMIFQLLS